MAQAKLKGRVRISLNEFGLGSVFINDTDISGLVSNVTFTAIAGAAPRVSLELISNTEVKADAEITVQDCIELPEQIKNA